MRSVNCMNLEGRNIVILYLRCKLLLNAHFIVQYNSESSDNVCDFLIFKNKNAISILLIISNCMTFSCNSTIGNIFSLFVLLIII